MAASEVDKSKTSDIKDGAACDDELQKMIIDLFMDNARLRKKINCFTRYALKIDRSVSDDSPVDTVTSNGMN